MGTRRIAVIDMGTNSLKFSVTEVDEGGNERVIEAATETVRLGAGIETTGRIEPERVARALDALRYFEQLARVHRAEACIGVATAALRLASNGGDLLDDIARTTGWKVRVISGDEEARLTFAGSLAKLPVFGTAMIADIGGGSTEVITVRDQELIASESLHVGSGTIADATFTTDPPGDDKVAQAVKLATQRLEASAVVRSGQGAALYLTGGNGMFLYELANWEEIGIPFTPSRFADLVQAVGRIPGERTAEYLQIAGERARMLPAGGAIALAIIELTQPESIHALPSGIRGGLVAEWIADHA